jgi:hypothetical protein
MFGVWENNGPRDSALVPVGLRSSLGPPVKPAAQFVAPEANRGPTQEKNTTGCSRLSAVAGMGRQRAVAANTSCAAQARMAGHLRRLPRVDAGQVCNGSVSYFASANTLWPRHEEFKPYFSPRSIALVVAPIHCCMDGSWPWASWGMGSGVCPLFG